MSIDITEYPWEGNLEKSHEDVPSFPRVSLDYFFLGADQVRRITRNSAENMSTKQLKRKLKTAGLPIKGNREELVARS